MNRLLLSFLALVAANLQAEGINFKIHALGGLDTNPHQLSEQMVPDEEIFTSLNFESKDSFSDIFYWDIQGGKTKYADDKRADSFFGQLNLSLASNFVLWETTYRYSIGSRYLYQDKTFVSRATGKIATLDGRSLADRFDYDEQGYFLGLEFSPGETFDYRLEYSTGDRNYVDYDIAQVDRLDNKQSEILLGVRLKTENKGYFFLELAHQNRQYADRQNRNELGERLVDTDLSYRNTVSNIGYVYQPENSVKWTYAFKYINRNVKGSKFFESQRGSFDITADYKLADYHFLSTQLAYRFYYYDENLAQPYEFFEEDEIEQRGVKFFIEYTWVMATLFDTNLGMYTRLEANQYESPDELFDYSQNRFSIGFRWAMD